MPSTKSFVQLLHSGAEIEISPAKLLKTGERIWNLERIYNLKAGFTRKDDTLPERLFEAGSAEKGNGFLRRQEFEAALRSITIIGAGIKRGYPSGKTWRIGNRLLKKNERSQGFYIRKNIRNIHRNIFRNRVHTDFI
nr:aldehyde ferredoxin oxidoreductase C-terminal domain-containing protein [Methanosarcina horonobensis]